jgi:hypothetical protein
METATTLCLARYFLTTNNQYVGALLCTRYQLFVPILAEISFLLHPWDDRGFQYTFLCLQYTLLKKIHSEDQEHQRKLPTRAFALVQAEFLFLMFRLRVLQKAPSFFSSDYVIKKSTYWSAIVIRSPTRVIRVSFCLSRSYVIMFKSLWILLWTLPTDIHISGDTSWIFFHQSLCKMLHMLNVFAKLTVTCTAYHLWHSYGQLQKGLCHL